MLAELRGDPGLANALGVELSHCHRELGLVLLERGDESGAIEQLGLALERSPTPELVADRIVVERAFDVLRGDQAWASRLELVRSGRTRAEAR